jgi:hypothetical protein
MTSTAATPDEYLASLPEDRRAALSAVREVILVNLPDGFEEGMQNGMIGYYVPHRLFPDGYHCNPKEPLPFAALASQKGHMSFYACHVYGDDEVQCWFVEAWAAAGKRLDMGKACVRFKRLEDVALDVVAQLVAKKSVADYVAHYIAQRDSMKSRKK